MIPRAALLALTAALALASFAAADPRVFTVHGPAGDVTLFGSIHVLPPGVAWEPPSLAKAVGQADELWFEIPIDPATQAQIGVLAQAKSLLPQGQHLSLLLSPVGLRRLKAIAARYRLSPARLDAMRPWYAEQAVTLSVILTDGAAADNGVEEQLSKGAPLAKREALETVGQQIALFADAPMADQIASLESTLKEIEDDPGAYRRMLDSWLKGDDEAIYQHDVLQLKRNLPSQYRALITDRNKAWVRILAERLRHPGKAVVVVGAGHLMGPEGVPAQLKALGFRVDEPGR